MKDVQRKRRWPEMVCGPARSRLSAITSVSAIFAVVSLPGTATAQSEGAACPVTATAQGVQVMASASDNLFLAAPSGLGLPVAQTCVDYGVKDSSGYASNPYPGEAIVSAPALLRGSTQQPIPGYPGYAASHYPTTQESKSEQQGYSLNARSTEVSSQAQARAGVGQDAASVASTVASSESTVDPKTKSSTATAKSETQPLTINDVLQVGTIKSFATARVDPSGKLVPGSGLEIGRTQVAGQVVTITPQGVVAAGQTVGAPQPPPTEVLEQAGIRVRYLNEEKTNEGVVSAGIEVTARQQHPDTGAVYTVQYTFGRAFAAAAAVSADSGGIAAPDEMGPSDPLPEAGGSPGEGSVAAGGSPVDVSPPAAGLAPTPGTVPPAVVSRPTSLAGNPVDMGGTAAYLVIVFAALGIFATGTLLRLLGVRTHWTS